MEVVAILADTELVEAALRHMGMWQDCAPRGPPIDVKAEPLPEMTREPWWDDLPPED
jgi:hypothetical protein